MAKPSKESILNFMPLYGFQRDKKKNVYGAH